MQLLEIKTRSAGRPSHRWIYASLAIMSAAVTTWALHVTQDAWRPPEIARHQSRPDVETPGSEIEALEAELVRIQRRLDELHSSAGD